MKNIWIVVLIIGVVMVVSGFVGTATGLYRNSPQRVPVNDSYSQNEITTQETQPVRYSHCGFYW